MNKHDLSNLTFLMNCTDAQFDNWCKTASSDDFLYALELFAEMRKEKTIKQLDEPIHDLSNAKSILNKFTLKGQNGL